MAKWSVDMKVLWASYTTKTFCMIMFNEDHQISLWHHANHGDFPILLLQIHSVNFLIYCNTGFSPYGEWSFPMLLSRCSPEGLRKKHSKPRKLHVMTERSPLTLRLLLTFWQRLWWAKRWVQSSLFLYFSSWDPDWSLTTFQPFFLLKITKKQCVHFNYLKFTALFKLCHNNFRNPSYIVTFPL